MISRRFTKSFHYVCAFEIVQVGREIDPVVRQIKLGLDTFGIVICDVVRQPVRPDLFTAFEGDRTLDRVFKLTDVAVPGVLF